MNFSALLNTDEEPEQCPTCNAMVPPGSLLEHYAEKHDPVLGPGLVYICRHCEYCSVSETLFSFHLSSHYNELMFYKCFKCSFVDKDKRAVQSHEKMDCHLNKGPSYLISLSISFSCDHCVELCPLQNPFVNRFFFLDHIFCLTRTID
jgi:hypothetical protein